MNRLLALGGDLADDLLDIRKLVMSAHPESSDESDGDNGGTPEPPMALASTKTECVPPKSLASTSMVPLPPKAPASTSMVPVPPKAVATKNSVRLLSRHLSEVSVDSDFAPDEKSVSKGLQIHL